MQTLTYLIFSIILFACAGKDDKSESMPHRTGTSNSDLGRSTNSTTTSPSSTTPEGSHTVIPNAEVPQTAIIPVSIAGASLTCAKTSSIEAQCVALDATGNVITFLPVQAFYQSEGSEELHVAKFKPGTVDGSWIVEIPEQNRSLAKFTITLEDSNKDKVQSWTLEPVPAAEPAETTPPSDPSPIVP